MTKPNPNRAHCPVCEGTLVFRLRTQDYRCMSCPEITPLAMLTPLQPVAPAAPIQPVPATGKPEVIDRPV